MKHCVQHTHWFAGVAMPLCLTAGSCAIQTSCHLQVSCHLHITCHLRNICNTQVMRHLSPPRSPLPMPYKPHVEQNGLNGARPPSSEAGAFDDVVTIVAHGTGVILLTSRPDMRTPKNRRWTCNYRGRRGITFGKPGHESHPWGA